jgi:hypothetical protein
MLTVASLKGKRDEIIDSIKLYEKQLQQSRSDLAHIQAAIHIFEASGNPSEMPTYVDTYRLFKRGEQSALCKEALASGPKSTQELAIHIMEAKGLDANDKILAKSIARQIIHTLRMMFERGRILQDGKNGRVIIWKLAQSA